MIEYERMREFEPNAELETAYYYTMYKRVQPMFAHATGTTLSRLHFRDF
jgi:hypothetical protein